ncbi:MAG: hypothetical protein Q8R64_01245 [Sulfurimicrobium sp.]|nr:hypothetical protein [Sulfurimicrobium sp.]
MQTSRDFQLRIEMALRAVSILNGLGGFPTTFASGKQMNRKKRDQTRYNRREVELDSDSIYYVSFAPKSGEIYEHSSLLDDPWNVRLDRNPIGKPGLVDAAI